MHYERRIAHARRVRSFGRRATDYALDYDRIITDAVFGLGVAIGILTALFIHGAAIIVAVGCAVPLIMED